MKYVLIIFFSLFTWSLQAQMIGLSYEVDTAFFEPTEPHPAGGLLYAELEGYTTYQVYANFTSETDELGSVFSDVGALSTPLMFVDAPCGCFNPENGDVLLGGNQNQLFFPVFPENAYDTFWTLDQTAGEQFISSNMNYNSTTMCSETISDGIVFLVIDQIPSAGDDLKIHVAQITTCSGFTLSACFQVFVGGSTDNTQVFCTEAGQELVVPEFGIGCMDAEACNYDIDAFEGDDSCVYPGCSDLFALNYVADAGCEATCIYGGPESCGPGTTWDPVMLHCVPDGTNCGSGTIWDEDSAQCIPMDNCLEDMDGNGVIDIVDVLQVLGAFGDECQ
ncbi:hypothetical protein N9L13_07890 [Flavobacteriales bacterium]|nr:hypothetical protein [Flavobacteriales bacterium]